MPLSAGVRLGPYEVLAPLGAGGMGEVYRARDPRLGRDVAIKVLPASLSKDPDRLKRFEQEARSAGVLNHPNVTIVYDIGQHDGAPYVVQELLEGETLRSELSGGRFSPRKAIDYAIQIAQGLAAAHEKGIIHRDLKPENLFVTKEGRVKILDFGLAKLIEVKGSASASNLPTATEPGLVMGTLGYISPEQIKNEPADARSDIFALGAVLYEMLSGQRAFRGDSTAEIMVTILKEDPPDLSLTNQNVSPGLERLVRHCIEKNPERRFQSARDLAYDLETLTTVSGAAAASVALGAPSRRWRKPLVAAAVLALGLLVGWGLHAIRQKPNAPSYKRLTFRRGTVFTGRFAPDGQTVVYSGSWEGEPARIYATRARSVESRGLQLPDARVLAVSPNGELAIQLGHQTVWDRIGTLARVPLDGGAPRELLEDVRAADWSPDGRDLAVVHQVGGKDRLEFPIGKVLYESADGMLSVRFSPRGDRLAISGYDNTIRTVDLSGKTTTITKGWSNLGNLAWRPDGSEIWFSAQKPSEQYALYAVTLSGRERLLRREAGGLFLHDISRDGRVLLNEYLWNSSLVGLPDGNTERDLTWMDQPLVQAISSDGRTIVFDEWGEGGGDNGSIYLRTMDGAPAARLGEGATMGFSADGRWILSRPPQPPETFVLLPAGPGQPRSVEHRGITTVDYAGRLLPDGKRFVFLGRPGNGSFRVYVQDLEGGAARAISPEGIVPSRMAVSPDGKFVATVGPDNRLAIYPVDGGASRPLPGAEVLERAIAWSADGGSIYVYRTFESPARVFKIDVATGKRELWKTITPVDRAGLITIDNIVMTPDARAYAYSFQRVLTNLEVVEGLR
jgi:eukaryotic-like serine/threonine-protein kinase